MAALLLIAGGAALLYFGAEWLVAGSAGLALRLGVRQLVVGLTVVAFGTSTPEVVVSVEAALDGATAIALGNVLGSNIANLGLILGLAVLLRPTRVDGQLARREVPMLLGSTALVPLLAWNGGLDRVDGLVLCTIALVYTVTMVMGARSRGTTAEAESAAATTADAAHGAGAPEARSGARLVFLIVVGLAVLILGGKLLVTGAVDLARAFGLSEALVGLTIVAVGTSLPELAASLVAAARGHGDIAVGNVIGSNIFNVLVCLGLAVLARPFDVSLASIRVELVALVAMTLLGALFMRTSRTMMRWEGGVLLGLYAAFVGTSVALSVLTAS